MFPVGRLVRGLGHKNLVKACTASTFSVRQRTLHYRSVFAFSESSYGHHDSESRIPLMQQTRSYYKQKTIKIPPTKPLTFDYAGDLDSLKDIDKTVPKLGFESSKELANAQEEIKRIFSLEFATGFDVKEKRIADLVQEVQFHPADQNSIEVRIAYLTIMIRNQVKHCQKFRKDKASKSQLVCRIQARKKYLRQLRKLDYKRFEWLLEKLKIKYVPLPKYANKKMRRINLKTEKWAETNNKIKEKMAAYREQLAKEKENFMVHKQETLAQIEKDLEELKIEEGSLLAQVHKKMKEKSQTF